MSVLKLLKEKGIRIVSTSLLLSMLATQSVSAATTVQDKIVSRGNIEYDADKDGEADVYFYSNDLKNIAAGIDALNGNLATLQTAYTNLNTTTSQFKLGIINGLNSNVYVKNNILQTATFDEIVQKINNIPTPEKGVGKYYSSGDNTGLNVGITSSKQSADVVFGNDTTFRLAVNESITLPAGFYKDDMTIQNNVINRTNTNMNKKTLNSGESVTFAEGYYTGGSVTANKMTKTYTASTADGTHSVSGGKAKWDMGDTNMNRYAEVPTTSASSTLLAHSESATIKPGYVDKTITIKAKTLEEQTPGTATANDILAGKTAWVKGKQLTGTIQNDVVKGGTNSSDGYTASIAAKKYTNAGSSVTVPKASTVGAINSSDGYTVSIAKESYTGKSGSSVTVNKAAISGATNSSDGYTASIAAQSYTGKSGSSVTVPKGSVSGTVNSSDGWTVSIPGGKYTGASGTSITVNKAAVSGGTNSSDGYTASIAAKSYTGKSGSSVTVPKAAATGAVNGSDGYTVSIAKESYTGKNGSSVTVNKAAVSGGTNSSDGYTASIAAQSYTGKNGSSVTVNKATISGTTNSSDGYDVKTSAAGYTGKNGLSLTLAKASVTGAAQSDGTFKYSIAGGKYTGASGSSGSIAKMNPSYSTGSSQSAVVAGGTVTIPANTYVKDKIVITAKDLKSQTAANATKDWILTGYSGWVNGVKVDGAMANNGSVKKTLDTQDANLSYTIAKGYHDGTGKISIVTESPSAEAKATDVTVKATNGKVIKQVTVKGVTKASGVGKDIYDAAVTETVNAVVANPAKYNLVSKTTYDTLQSSYDTLSKNHESYRTSLISALNSTVYRSSNIAGTATYDVIIQKIQNIASPSTATAKYITNGDNTGLYAGLTASAPSKSISISGKTSLNLGVNEAITLPAGYYASDITVRNNVANKGSLTTSSTAAGYYSNVSTALTQAYNNGVTAGKSQATTSVYDIKYEIVDLNAENEIVYTFTKDCKCEYIITATFSATNNHNANESVLEVLLNGSQKYYQRDEGYCDSAGRLHGFWIQWTDDMYGRAYSKTYKATGSIDAKKGDKITIKCRAEGTVYKANQSNMLILGVL